MVASHTDGFATAVREVGASATVTSASAFAGTLSELVREPAVGAELPFEGVSYDDTPVTVAPTGAALAEAATGVTAGALGVADYGSVLLRETGRGEELLGLYPNLHVVVVAASDVVADMPAAFDRLDETISEEPADVIVATGPSATADMGAVVTGVHGPRDVHVVVLEDR